MNEYNVTMHKGGAIATIEFSSIYGNSMPLGLLKELKDTIHKAASDIDVNVIVLQSTGRNFCNGAYINELFTLDNEASGKAFFKGFANLINEMRKCSKLIIGRVHAKSVGGGVGLIAACDYAIALEGADIKLSELGLGIGPFVIGPAVARKIGESAFSQIAIDSTMWRNGDWARKKGLYAELHPNEESMNESVLRLAHTLAHSNVKAMAEMKKMFWQGTDNWDQLLDERAAISGKLIVSEYSKAKINAIKLKQLEKSN